MGSGKGGKPGAILNNGIDAINDALPTDEFQIRLQFNELETNADGVGDVVRGKFDLVITYR